MKAATIQRISITLLAACALARAALGQDRLEPLEHYEPVEAGVADVDPLSTSLRDLRYDLRTPAEFDRVYRVPGHPDLLMRVHGSLFAVFPLSVYERTRFGPVPVVPNNTVFYIGEDSLRDLAVASDTTPTAGRPPNGVADRIDLRADADAGVVANVPRLDREGSRRAHPSPESRIAPLPLPVIELSQWDVEDRSDVSPEIVRNAAYRTERIRALMRRAAQAARGQSSSSS